MSRPATRDAAQARLSQVRNGRAYAQLRTPAAGIVTEVTGQAGQVVAAGQPVATLAQAGAREVEVFFPET
ncbi:MAG: HlyD family efflux transporter periplasmic adaptor subunit, partial [Candidatus Sericytochromatia bacterium]